MPARLYDCVLDRELTLNRQDISNDDVADFCKANRVRFYTATSADRTVDPNEATHIRVATRGSPSRGIDVPVWQIVSWLDARKRTGPHIDAGGMYRHCKHGLVTTMAFAKRSSNDSDSVVVFHSETDELLYEPYDSFFGTHTDTGTCRIEPNVEFIRKVTV